MHLILPNGSTKEIDWHDAERAKFNNREGVSLRFRSNSDQGAYRLMMTLEESILIGSTILDLAARTALKLGEGR